MTLFTFKQIVCLNLNKRRASSHFPDCSFCRGHISDGQFHHTMFRFLQNFVYQTVKCIINVRTLSWSKTSVPAYSEEDQEQAGQQEVNTLFSQYKSTFYQPSCKVQDIVSSLCHFVVCSVCRTNQKKSNEMLFFGKFEQVTK